MSWKGWNWLNEAVLPLALVLMRATWVWLWLALLERLAPPAYEGILLPLPWVAGLLLASTALTRWLGRWAGTRPGTAPGAPTWERVVIAVLGLGALFLVIWQQFFRVDFALFDPGWVRAWAEEMIFWGELPPRSVFLLPPLIYLWLRGILDGSGKTEHGDVLRAFSGGCLAIALFLLAGQLDSRALPEGTGLAIFVFFGAAMVAMALASVKLAPMLQNGALVSPAAINRYWLGSVLGIIAVLLAVALLLSSLIAPEMVAQLLATVWDVVSQVLLFVFMAISIILYPILYLMWLVVPAIYRLIESFFGGSELFARLAAMADGFQREETPQEMAASVPVELRWIGLVLFVVAVGLLFALMWRRWQRDREDDVEETRESVLSGELLMAQLAGLWPRFFGRRAEDGAFDPYLSLAGEVEARRLIRKIYQSLLAAATAAGQPRRREQTPAGYGRELGERLPESQQALDVITASYVQARYDGAPPTQERAERARRAWEEVLGRMGDDKVTR